MVHNALWNARAISFTVKCKALLTEADLHLNYTRPLTIMYMVISRVLWSVPHFALQGSLKGQVLLSPVAPSKEEDEEEKTGDPPLCIHCSWQDSGDSWNRLFLHQTREKKGKAGNICWWDRLPPATVPPLPPHIHITCNSSSKPGPAMGYDKLDSMFGCPSSILK